MLEEFNYTCASSTRLRLVDNAGIQVNEMRVTGQRDLFTQIPSGALMDVYR